MDKKTIKKQTTKFLVDNIVISIMIIAVIFCFFYMRIYAHGLLVAILGSLIVIGLLIYLYFSIRTIARIMADVHRGNLEEHEGDIAHYVPDLRYDISFFMPGKTYVGLKFRERKEDRFKMAHPPEDFKLKKFMRVRAIYLPKSKIIVSLELIEDWSEEMKRALNEKECE
ncbi:MAG: hypothetical protein R2876_02270 [Eubacteriales bacterium]